MSFPVIARIAIPDSYSCMQVNFACPENKKVATKWKLNEPLMPIIKLKDAENHLFPIIILLANVDNIIPYHHQKL